MFARRFRLWRQRRNGHQALNTQTRKRKERLHSSSEGIGRKPDLAPLARDVDFQQDARMQSFFVRDPVHLASELDRIDAVEKLEERKRMPDLVLLQSADEMPARARGQQWDFRARLLDAAFAKELLSGVERRANLFRLVGF